MLESLINVLLGVAELAALIAIVALIRRRLPDLRIIGITLLVLFLAHLALFVTPSPAHLGIPIHTEWNWAGKVVSILVTLACIAVIPSVSWTDAGFTWKQNGGLVPGLIAVALTILWAWGSNVLFGGFHLKMPDTETLLFQATMPGFNEEPLYRGVALLLIDRAFGNEYKSLWGAPIGWGAVITALWFGMIHGNGFGGGQFHIDPVVIAIIAVDGFGLAWIRMRTKSLALCVLAHNVLNVGEQFI